MVIVKVEEVTLHNLSGHCRVPSFSLGPGHTHALLGSAPRPNGQVSRRSEEGKSVLHACVARIHPSPQWREHEFKNSKTWVSVPLGSLSWGTSDESLCSFKPASSAVK